MGWRGWGGGIGGAGIAAAADGREEGDLVSVGERVGGAGVLMIDGDGDGGPGNGCGRDAVLTDAEQVADGSAGGQVHGGPMGRGSVGTGGQVIAEDSKGKQGHAHERSSIICQLLTNWTFGMRDRASEVLLGAGIISGRLRGRVSCGDGRWREPGPDSGLEGMLRSSLLEMERWRRRPSMSSPLADGGEGIVWQVGARRGHGNMTGNAIHPFSGVNFRWRIR
jgi:hypothetical protein